MAAVAAILRAIFRTLVRDLRSLHAVQGNNFFWVVALILYQQPDSAIFLVLILAIVLILPFTTEPLRKIPSDRLALWPLSGAQRVALRAGSLVLSPVFWIAATILIRTATPGLAIGMIIAAIVFQSIAAGLKRLAIWVPQSNPLRLMPGFPGALGQLYPKDLRQMLSTLDPYIAIVLAGSGCAYRFLATAPAPEAFPVLSVMVAIALSTYGQCMFGLDGAAGIMRYRLMPLRGWQIFLSKDLAFLTILSCLVLPLSPAAGVAAGLVALAVGRHHAIAHPTPQGRWRLTSGALFPIGVIQMISMVVIGASVYGTSSYWFFAALLVYFVSLWWHGRAWEKTA